MTPNVQITKEKYTNWTSRKFNNFVYKRHYQKNKKAAHTMGENICKSYIWYGINVQTMREFLKLNNKKTKQPNSKMGKGLEQTFL